MFVQFTSIAPVLLVMPAIGFVMSFVIVIVSVSVHPLAAVTVTVYVPASETDNASTALTVEVPSDQEYVPPPVAVKLIVGFVQSIWVTPVLFVIPATGGEATFVIAIKSLAVQPFAAVTVTVYVPALETVKPATELTVEVPSDQEYVPPPVAVKLIEVLIQSIWVTPVLLVIPTVGAVMSFVIDMLSVSVHPFEPVTVTMYVPALETIKPATELTVEVPSDQE